MSNQATAGSMPVNNTPQTLSTSTAGSMPVNNTPQTLSTSTAGSMPVNNNPQPLFISTADPVAAGTVDVRNIRESQVNSGSVSGDKIYGSYVFGGSIASETISGSDITGGSITSDIILSSTVNGGRIDAERIYNSSASSGGVTAGHITNSTISGGSIKANSISSSRVSGGFIEADYISSSTVSGGCVESDTICAGQVSGGTIRARSIVASSVTGGSVRVNTIRAGFFAGGSLTANIVSTVSASADSIGTIVENNSLMSEPSEDVQEQIANAQLPKESERKIIVSKPSEQEQGVDDNVVTRSESNTVSSEHSAQVERKTEGYLDAACETSMLGSKLQDQEKSDHMNGRNETRMSNSHEGAVESTVVTTVTCTKSGTLHITIKTDQGCKRDAKVSILEGVCEDAKHQDNTGANYDEETVEGQESLDDQADSDQGQPNKKFCKRN